MLAKAVKVTPGPDQTQLLQCSKVNLSLLLVQLQVLPCTGVTTRMHIARNCAMHCGTTCARPAKLDSYSEQSERLL